MNYKFNKIFESNNPDIITKILMTQQYSKDINKNNIIILINSLETCCKLIAHKIRKAGIHNLYGYENNINSTGDIQKTIDVISNDIFKNSLKNTNLVNAMASEEEENIIILDNSKGKYFVSFDPLDGSTNIDCNVSIGSIFGIWQKTDSDTHKLKFLEKGYEMIASGYCIYGPSTQMVLSINDKVNCFTLDPNIGEFILTHENIMVPEYNRIYSINEGNNNFWFDSTKKYIDHIKKMDKSFSLRYVGSMVSDVHRTLFYGGIFMYPLDKKNKIGKLRVLYESLPMAFIFKNSNGRSRSEKKDFIDMEITDIHSRSGVFIGSKLNIEEYEKIIKN